MADKELHKILKVGNDEYKINAVHSDAAAQVDNKLIIDESTLSEVIHKEFNGISEETISIVPSTGGVFTGPIKVPEFDGDDTDEKNSYVVNLGDIKQRIQLLTGHPCYNWDGENLTEYTMSDGKTIKNVSLISGKAEDFGKFNSSVEIKPEFYLYICTDTGDIIFCRESGTHKIISTRSFKLDYNNGLEGTDGWTAKSIQDEFDSIENNFDSLNSYIDDKIIEIDSKFDPVNNSIKGITENITIVSDELANLHDTTNAKISNIESSHNSDISELGSEISKLDKNLRALIDNEHEVRMTKDEILNDRIDRILNDGSNETVKKAVSATKATQDGLGNNINNYYQKKAYISLNTPDPSIGIDGDIWIHYSNK